MGLNKARGQSESNQRVMFLLTLVGGTPTVTLVSPREAAGDITVADTAPGSATVTIKNFQGPQSAVNIQLTAHTNQAFAAAVSRAYSGADLSFIVDVAENDSATLEDFNVDVCAEAY